ncbi:hypothetical protein L3049_13595 [Labilibaculum sp. DW002]|uniref:Uncharacterized protein n=1 Tax=Paralabilibaculum antarcticum TaxID=2912572 RepID=A0ABT5VUD2_9BACT|nr:hypothetical protein [Labilibaculum sp. DW002]MDE5419034.1 hypothetical protein [Labilibaculum sp. DW002]
MNFRETLNEKYFDSKDELMIRAIRRKDKKRILILTLLFIAATLIIPVIPGRNGEYLIDSMTYLNSIALCALIFLVLIGLPMFIFMTRKNTDYNNRKKIVMETRIKNIRQDKSDISLSFTNPDFKSKWIFVYRDKIYHGIEKDDSIRISYLPKTKFVLELEKI